MSASQCEGGGNRKLCFGSLDFLCDVHATGYELVKHCSMRLVVIARDAGIATPIESRQASMTLSLSSVRLEMLFSWDALGGVYPSHVPHSEFTAPAKGRKGRVAKSVTSLAAGESTFVYEGKIIDASFCVKPKPSCGSVCAAIEVYAIYSDTGGGRLKVVEAPSGIQELSKG